MKIQRRTPREISFSVVNNDITSNNEIVVTLYKNGQYTPRKGLALHVDQLKLLAEQPHAVYWFAKFLVKHFKERYGVTNIAVYSNLIVEFNRRAPQHLIDTKRDLADASYKLFESTNWIKRLNN